MRKENRVIIAALSQMKNEINKAISRVRTADRCDLKKILEETFEFSPEMERLTSKLQDFMTRSR